MSSKPLVLYDASNAWYRAYTATFLDPPGGPVFIFCSMLRKMAREYGKDNLVICWDAGDGGRAKLDPEYKAQRKHVKGVWEDLKYAKRMVAHLGIKTARTTGYEADDTIGSLATQSDREILITSYDKDFYQLVSDRIKIFRPGRKIRGEQQPDRIVGPAEVLEEFGCPAEAIILHKAFKGDSADNIPKIDIRFTKKFKEPFYAVLQTARSVEDFYAQLDQFDSKYHDKLNAFRARAELNHKMVTIHKDITPALTDTPLDEAAVQALCEEIEIKSVALNEWKHLSNDDVQAEINAKDAVQGSLFG